MICPHCQNESPEDHKGKKCPICGASKGRFRWPLFLCGLLLPPILTLVSAGIFRHTLSNPVNENITPPIALISGAIGGIVCGSLLAFRASERPSTPYRALHCAFRLNDRRLRDALPLWMFRRWLSI
jgi:hypothetical protein